MSRYYHAFKVGFNYWYIALIVGLMVSFVLGLFIYNVKKTKNGEYKIRRMRPEKYWTVVGLIVIILMIMISQESSDGLQQMCDNMLVATDSPIYGELLACFGWVVCAGMIIVLNVGVMILGAEISHSAAIEKIKKLCDKRQK